MTLKLPAAAFLASLALSAGCKDVKVENDLADARKNLADSEDELESSHKKLKAAESAQSAAEARAKLAEAKLKESEAKLKEADAKLRAHADASVVSDPNAPATPASGNAACDRYWAKFRACNDAALKSAPPSTRAAMEKSLADAEKQTKEAWAKMDAAVMNKACETMVDALSQNPNCPK